MVHGSGQLEQAAQLRIVLPAVAQIDHAAAATAQIIRIRRVPHRLAVIVYPGVLTASPPVLVDFSGGSGLVAIGGNDEAHLVLLDLGCSQNGLAKESQLGIREAGKVEEGSVLVAGD